MLAGVLLMSDGISSCAFRKDSMLWYACYFEKRQLAAELFRKGDAVMEDDDSSDSSLLHALVVGIDSSIPNCYQLTQLSY